MKNLLIKLCVLIIKLLKKLFCTEEKFIKLILNEYNFWRKIIRKYFCKNLFMSAEENEKFAYKVVCVDNKVIKKTFMYRGKIY